MAGTAVFGTVHPALRSGAASHGTSATFSAPRPFPLVS